jgi:DNA-binding MarR family transcriptional regulator
MRDMSGEAGEQPVDAIDLTIQQWRRQRPDLDLSAMDMFARLGRLARLLEPTVEQVFARHGLRKGEFDVLAALRTAAHPHTLIPSELSATLMMSRAGMTNRLDRLEAAGLVARTLDPADRRSFRIALTDQGERVIDATVTDHAANLTRLAATLGPEDAASLDRIVRTMLAKLDQPTEAAEAEA